MQNQNTRSSRPKRKHPRPQQQQKRSLTPTAAVKPSASLSDFPKNCSLTGSDLPLELLRPLRPKECDLWSSSLAAKYAAELHLPTCRQLGVIQRTLKAKKGFALSKLQENPKKKKRKVTTTPMFNNGNKVKTMWIPTLNQAKNHVRGSISFDSDGAVDLDEKLVEKRAQEWQKQWKAVRDKGRFVPGFDLKSGEFLDRHLHDDGAITCGELLACMKRKRPQLEDISTTPAFYCPYPTTEENKSESMIKFDTKTVLEALVDLMRPHSKLYNQPLVVAHARLIPENNAKDHLYRLHIAVYANRLLFEVMTWELQVVMAALDQSSYKIDQPLQVPPSITLATQDFASAIHPKVKFGGDDEDDADEEEDATMDNTGAEQQEEGATRGNTKTVDAFSIPGLFKLIENTGTFDEGLWDETLQPKLVKRDNKSGLNLDLLVHQKHGLCWCYQMERLGNLNRLVWECRQFPEGDTYYYSPALGQVRLTLSEEAGSGGVLCDEMGLGKTIQILALIVATLDEVKAKTRQLKEEFDDDEDKDNCRHTTLIIVPPALLSQWIAEIQKVAPWLVVDALVYGRGSLERVQQPQQTQVQEEADVIVTTYQAVEDNYNNSNKRWYQPGTLSLADFHFSRIVLDEMQEIRSFSNRISKVINKLQSDRRWMLSGTPLLDGVSDLKGELCFLGLEPFAAANDDGFFDFAIESHWENKSRYGLSILRMMSGLIMLRRSKSMVIRQTGQPLLGLKPFTLTYEPVPQEQSERALYCFLEYLMHSTVPQKPVVTNNDATGSDRVRLQSLQQHQRNKFAFLRMLRELCVSPTLLNGGLGVTSQLDTLNRWMKDYNRRLQQAKQSGSTGGGDRRQSSQKTLSCDEAVVYLSQVEDLARTDGDFVTDVRFGGSGGISNRNRALETLDKRYQEKTEELVRTKKLCKTASHKWAKAHWHKALELVTTGRLFARSDEDFYQNTNPEIRRLWRWRYCAISCSSSDSKSVKTMLFRGWRPSESLLDKSSARKFLFANPFALILSDIPCLVAISEVRVAILQCLQENESCDPNIDVVALSHEECTKIWKAVVHLQNESDFEYLLKKIKGADGIQLLCSENIPLIDEEIREKKVMLDEAIAANRVHPNPINAQSEARAKKEYSRAQRGLRIICNSKKCNTGHVGCEKGLARLRNAKPDSAMELLSSTARQIHEATSVFVTKCNTTVTKQHGMIKEKEEELQRIDSRIKSGVTRQVGDLTTVGVLQALKEGQVVDCDICLDKLGFGYGASDGMVALTRCGHLSCRSCMMNSIQQNQKCFQCRKLVTRDQLVFVDPKKKDDQVRFEKKQAEAKSLVRQAAEMLDNNHGLLKPHLWEALYLSMPLPTNVSRSAHQTFTAIPPHVLAHLRNATDMPVHCTRKQPSGDDMGYKFSSKIRALLSDLPRDELSVVFASSKVTIEHLLVVFEKMRIGCRALFTGQSEKDSELAVSEWQSDDNVTVLVVQAGAAACGLTLTAARKMFLLDPFLKHEEEKQAYARLHRYGQTKEVFCKVYYTPVSVESRLLEWRHRFEKEETHAVSEDEEKMIFAPLRNVVADDEMDSVSTSSSDDDEEEDESPDDIKQTQFLLGLT